MKPQIFMAGESEDALARIAKLRQKFGMGLLPWEQAVIDAHNDAHCSAPGHDAFVRAFGKCTMCDPGTKWIEIPACR
jgi:hypothetical protein